MTKFIENILLSFKDISAELWLIIGLGVVAFVFLLGLVISLVTGDLSKFKSAVSKIKKTPNNETAKAAALQMPIKVRKLYKTAKTSGAKPSDIIGIDACVNTPFAASFSSKFCRLILTVSAFISVIVFALGSAGIGSVTTDMLFVLGGVLAGGGVFAFIAAIIGSSIYRGGVKSFNFYVETLDVLAKGGTIMEEPEEEKESPKKEKAKPVKEKKEKKAKEEQQQNENVVEEQPVMGEVTDIPFAQEVETTPVLTANPRPIPSLADLEDDEEEEPVKPKVYDEFSEPSRITVELADDDSSFAQSEPIVVAPPQESEAEFKARAREEAIRQMRAQQAAATAETTVKASEPPQKSAAELRQEQLEKAKAAAAARASANPAPSSSSSANSTDDIIARIEQIKANGAPLATMKEVALLLQQERAKPENKTPEQQRKLNEALASLLKAMSSATRK